MDKLTPFKLSLRVPYTFAFSIMLFASTETASAFSDGHSILGFTSRKSLKPKLYMDLATRPIFSGNCVSTNTIAILSKFIWV